MGNRQKSHRAINVYGDGEIETVENALSAADSETDAEAIVEICAAYTGMDYRDRDS